MTLDRAAKVIAVLGALGSFGGVVAGVWLGARGKAEASEVRANTGKISILETRSELIYEMVKEQRQDVRDIRYQLNRLAETGRIPVVPLKEKK